MIYICKKEHLYKVYYLMSINKLHWDEGAVKVYYDTWIMVSVTVRSQVWYVDENHITVQKRDNGLI